MATLNNMTTYEQCRPIMQTGDCLLYRSNSFLGKAIRIFSPRYNHAGLVIRIDQYQGTAGRIWTLEALEHGIVLNYLSERLLDFSGEVWWFPVRAAVGSDEVRCKIGEFALAQAGRPYDYSSLFRNILGRVSANARRLFCSELAFLAWKYAGIVDGEKAPRPGDIPGLGIFDREIQII